MNLTGAKEDGNQKKDCQMCQKNHDLDAGFKYKHSNQNKSKLCFGCYDVISKEYSGKNCPKRQKSSICKEQHPTGLHGLQSKKRSPEKEDDNHTPLMPPGNQEKKDSVKACALTVPHIEVISMYVIPVEVKYKDSNSVYSTFAVLDNCSQGCFVNSSLVKNLRIKFTKLLLV